MSATAAAAMLFALPVRVEICRRNPRRLVVLDANGAVLLRTLSRSLRDIDIAERFVVAMNAWSLMHHDGPADALRPLRYALPGIAPVPPDPSDPEPSRRQA